MPEKLCRTEQSKVGGERFIHLGRFYAVQRIASKPPENSPGPSRPRSSESECLAQTNVGRLRLSNPARFQVDPQLAHLLGEGYRSSEQALKELVDNAWDAEARTVRITLPGPMTKDPIIISDDGAGMTENEVRSEYLKVASARRSRRGERTPVLNRQVKGRKGIGKFAGLMAAAVMGLDTRSRGQRTSLRIRKEDLLQSQTDLEGIDLQLVSEPCEPDASGTTVTLSELNQGLEFPAPERLRELLVLEYGRNADFSIVVNGEPLAVEDIPGEQITHVTELPGVGRVAMNVTVADSNKPLKHSGIVIRVGGKVVGRPMYLGLEENEEIPPRLLRKLYGEIEADGLVGDVTSDWGAIIENSTALAAVQAWARTALEQGVRKTFVREVRNARARQQKAIDDRLARLPEHRRSLAEQALSRIFLKFYGESEDRIGTIISVTLDAFERDEYWAVVRALEDARHQEVGVLADAIASFGLVDVALMAQQAKRRLAVLDSLDELLVRPGTLEQEMHTVFEHNLWLLEADYQLRSSNKTLATVLKDWAGQAFKGARARMRPDLFLCANAEQRYLLIEFKEPQHTLSREDEMQALKYRDDLLPQFSPIDVLVIGGRRSQAQLLGTNYPHLNVATYVEVVSKARSRLQWLATGG